VGIVAAIAFDEERDRHLRAIDARHLFADNMTRLAVRRSAYLRDYVYEFIQTFASPLKREVVDAARHEPPALQDAAREPVLAWSKAA
jgi:LysR family cys regulon transcriptional activator